MLLKLRTKHDCHDRAYTRPPPTPVLHLLQHSSHASTFLPRFNVPHMLQRSSHASTFLTCFNSPSSTCFNVPHMLRTDFICYNNLHLNAALASYTPVSRLRA